MAFTEHNNRQKANTFAEYITGQALRQYLAEKVAFYVGNQPSVFDGAAGSGQLEQFIQPKAFVAVEIQAEACQALKGNYPQADVNQTSFFLYQSDVQCDCVVMNPPFSMKFKDLSAEEQRAIQAEFPWKKSGVVDDVFVLKGLAHSSRWGFFILFPGVGYRQAEKTFRALLGNQLVELNVIKNAFDDTQIDVLFLVVDKLKTGNTAKRELVDCKTQQVIVSDEWRIDPSHWELIPPPPPPKEQIDPIALEYDARKLALGRIQAEIAFSKMVCEFENIDLMPFLLDIQALVKTEIAQWQQERAESSQ